MPSKDRVALDDFALDAHEVRLQKVESTLSDVKAEVSGLSVNVGNLSSNIEKGFNDNSLVNASILAKLDAQKEEKFKELEAKGKEKSKTVRNFIIGIILAVLPVLAERLFFHH